MVRPEIKTCDTLTAQNLQQDVEKAKVCNDKCMGVARGYLVHPIALRLIRT